MDELVDGWVVGYNSQTAIFVSFPVVIEDLLVLETHVQLTQAPVIHRIGNYLFYALNLFENMEPKIYTERLKTNFLNIDMINSR